MGAISLAGMPGRLASKLASEKRNIIRELFPNNFRDHTCKFAPALIRRMLEQVIEQSDCTVDLYGYSEISRFNLENIFLKITRQFVELEGGVIELAVVHILRLIDCELNGLIPFCPVYRSEALRFAAGW